MRYERPTNSNFSRIVRSTSLPFAFMARLSFGSAVAKHSS